MNAIKQKPVVLQSIVLFLCFSITKGTITSLSRCVGNNIADDGDTWAIGYKGDFYEATFNNKPTEFQWKFAEEATTCSFNLGSLKCIPSNDFYSVTYTDDDKKTTMNLKRELTDEEVGSEVTISQDSLDNYKSKFVSVSGCTNNIATDANGNYSFGSVGVFQCKDEENCLFDIGGSSIPSDLQGKETICQADAKWKNESYVECKSPNYDVALERSVGQGDNWAIGYSGGFYKGIVSTTSLYKVGWILNSQTYESEVVFDKGVTKCKENNFNCQENNGELVVELSLAQELSSGINKSITFYSYKYDTCGKKNHTSIFSVEGCTTTPPIIVTDGTGIELRSANYNVKGNFACNDDGELFDAIGPNKVKSFNTKCGVDAIWVNYTSEWQCWKEPQNVELGGTFELKEEDGNAVTFTCKYNELTLPAVGEIKFYFDETLVVKSGPTVNSITKKIDRNDNGSSASCVASNSFTEYYTSDGVSSKVETLKVYYKANITSILVNNKNGALKIDDENLYLRSDIELDVTCDVDSNPEAICVWTIDSQTYSGCTRKQSLGKSGLVKCSASNSEYDDNSVERDINITLVDSNRAPTVSSNSSTKNFYTVKEGDSCEFHCEVELENELNSTIQWILPIDASIDNENSFVLENVSVENDNGLYECSYTDKLDSDSTKFNLDVQYYPRILNEENLEPNQCDWTINSTSECILRFNCNPAVESFAILKGTTNATSQFTLCHNFDYERRTEYVTLKKEKAQQSDSGHYTLIVKSEYFVASPPLYINFTINVVDKIPPVTVDGPNLAVIISCSIVGVLVVLIVIGFFVRKNHYNKRNYEDQQAQENFNLSLRSSSKSSKKEKTTASDLLKKIKSSIKRQSKKSSTKSHNEKENKAFSNNEAPYEEDYTIVKIKDLKEDQKQRDIHPSPDIEEDIEDGNDLANFIPTDTYCEIDQDGEIKTKKDKKPPLKKESTYMDVYAIVNKPKKKNTAPGKVNIQSATTTALPKTNKKSEPEDLYVGVNKPTKVKPKPPIKPKPSVKPKPPVKPTNLSSKLNLSKSGGNDQSGT